MVQNSPEYLCTVQNCVRHAAALCDTDVLRPYSLKYTFIVPTNIQANYSDDKAFGSFRARKGTL